MQVQLKVANGKQAGQLITINRPKFMIGRAEDCHLKPRNELISRYHCVILLEEGYAGIRDLGSRNGVYVNGEKIDGEVELHNGDMLSVGPLEFEIVISVAMSAGKKPKVESIADVVARTVEQSSLTGSDTARSANNENTEMMGWILNEEESETAADAKTITAAKVPTGTMQAAEEKKTAPASKPAPKPVKVAEKKEEKPVLAKTAPAAPGETANALMNFFKSR